jgi:hypothetical protein
MKAGFFRNIPARENEGHGMMKNSIKPLRIVGAVCVWVLLWGCGGKMVTTLIQKDPLFEVYLQRAVGKDDKPADAGYQHPISLSPEEVHRLLQSIQVRYQPGILHQIFSGSDRQIQPAFTHDEIQRMEAGISKALESATSADRVSFRLKHPRGIFTPSITTGVVYLKDDRFTVILGNYQYIPSLDARDTYSQFSDPLDTQGSQTTTIVPGPFQELYKSERSRLKNRWLLVDYKALLSTPSQLKTETPQIPESLEEKLNTLKRFRDQGLITEEEYQEKKKELLKEF